MRVHHLNCGTMCPIGRRLMDTEGGLLERHEMVCHCLLVETDRDGLILVDTGLGTQDNANQHLFPGWWKALVQPRFSDQKTAIRQIETMGFQPRDVRHIVLTHMDLDHAGGLRDFPQATVHLHKREHEAVMKRDLPGETHRYLPHQWAHGPHWQQYDAAEGDDWFGFQSVRAVGDDVLIIPLHGHTRGHSGVAVKTAKGWLLHAGDAFFFRDEIHPTAPGCPAGLRFFQRVLAVDNPVRLENQHRLRALNTDHGDQVTLVNAHDPQLLRRMQAR